MAFEFGCGFDVTSSLCLKSRALGLSPLQQQQLFFAHTSFSASDINSTHPVSATFTKRCYDWRVPEWHRVWRTGTVSTARAGLLLRFAALLHILYIFNYHGVVDVERTSRKSCKWIVRWYHRTSFMDATGQTWILVGGWMNGWKELPLFFGFFRWFQHTTQIRFEGLTAA
ncbi:hypothetical protein DL98DRAFT_286783 [Cadophora sp. DSE1049]|nr:hypothetical protein DL98DRAFT_286783 [Cadophora sp. DSE1049]